ncbi:MAG: hydrogenase maturation nickel metallochaperone HypA [Bacillota bacterium]|nr:hydrogenase maturation nickel metallochaperone HypA [Bacillota bacterium]
MHEVGIMEGALDMARRLLEENGGSRLVRVHMTIGSLSGVVPDALQSAFLALKDAYAAGNAALEVTWVEALCRCDDCQEDFLFTDHGYLSPPFSSFLLLSPPFSSFLLLSPPFSSFLLLSPFRSHPEKIRKFTRTFFTSGRSNILAYYYYAANSNPAVEPIP